jgi:glycosyltransferase involved in cell wall biosynthesis
MKSRLRIGVITDEFFDLSLGRMGGFGWAARQLGRIFGEDPSYGVDLVYLASELAAERSKGETVTQGHRVILRRSTRLANLLAARREKFDLLLTIDYNLGHSVWMRSVPRTPCIVWIRDPRTAADVEKIRTLKIPGASGEAPQGLYCHDGHSLNRIAEEAKWLGRKLLFATPAPHLAEKCEGTYGFEPWDIRLLPNAVSANSETDTRRAAKSARPSVIFLGRVDPIKRPWIFSALAARFPQADFKIMGQPHFHGPGTWVPKGLPANLEMLGHVDGQEKSSLLSAAWVTVNTSIHEALAISFMESLAHGTPLLSCQNPGFVVSRYGIYTGRYDGDGMDSLDSFSAGLSTLLDSPSLRRDLGQNGREWVAVVHSKPSFRRCFQTLCQLAGAQV